LANKATEAIGKTVFMIYQFGSVYIAVNGKIVIGLFCHH